MSNNNINNQPEKIIEDIKKILGENDIYNYTLKVGDQVRKNGSVPQAAKKSITWIIDDLIEENKIILLEYNDPVAFLHTDKTPEEVDQFIKDYLAKPK